jgi:hypothetical protein
MSNVTVKLLLVMINMQYCLATDLFSWTAAQTFTVGQPHANVLAMSKSTPDTAWADPNDCASITPHGGFGNFINYDTVELSF